jgi:trimethylamine--corrinoid protein Co-methyltransferase
LKRNLHAGRRQSGGLGLKIFTDDELEEIHLATLEVLQNTGLFIEGEEALDILDGGGAVVDRNKKVVKFPPYLVEDAIRSAPSKLLLAGRNPKNDFVMESNRVGFTNFGEGVFVIDPYNGKLRETTKADVADSAKIVDYLSELDVYERAVGASDVCRSLASQHLQTRIHGFRKRFFDKKTHQNGCCHCRRRRQTARTTDNFLCHLSHKPIAADKRLL